MLVGDAQRVRADEAEQSIFGRAELGGRGERRRGARAREMRRSESFYGTAKDRLRGCTTGSLTFLRAKVQSGAVFPSVFVREDGEKSCRVSSSSLLISAEPLTLRRVHPTIE